MRRVALAAVLIYLALSTQSARAGIEGGQDDTTPGGGVKDGVPEAVVIVGPADEVIAKASPGGKGGSWTCRYFPFLPGDTLLFALGLFIAGSNTTGYSVVGISNEPTELVIAMALLVVAAFAGNVAGYEIGRKIGPPLYERDGKILKRKYFDQTSAFFEKHGNKALVIGRFVPFVRTYITVVAGVTLMDDPAQESYPTPLDAAGSDGVLVGRIRGDSSLPGAITFWTVTDSIRKGAATNVVQVIEAAAARNLIRR